MGYQSVNPADGKVLKTFKELTDKELESKTCGRRDLLRKLAPQDICRAGQNCLKSRRPDAREG